MHSKDFIRTIADEDIAAIAKGAMRRAATHFDEAILAGGSAGQYLDADHELELVGEVVDEMRARIGRKLGPTKQP